MSDSPRRKSFAFQKTNKPSSVSFEINKGVVINCKKELDGLSILEFSSIAALAESEDPHEQAKASSAVTDFLKTAIVDWDEFVKQVKAEDSGVGAEELGEIAGWLVEQYVERPTE